MVVLLVLCLGGFLAPSAVRADDTRPGPDDRFAAEPKRPRAEKGVRFSESWEMARAEARRSGRRVLAYFTGDHCGWCRVMEERTFRDAEVAALSQRFVCVELNVGKEENLRLADEFAIDSIPRSLVLTAEGRVIDRRTGYTPAAEYAAWLTGAATRPPAPVGTGGSKHVVPQPVGAPESAADLVVWFVDASNSMPRWGDADWTGHPHLIHLLRAAGLRPRIEHMARDDFPARWDRAEGAGKVPDLIAAERLAGLVRDLSEKKRLVGVVSSRLQKASGNASCPDFAGRFVLLVKASGNEESGRKAAAEILRPAPESSLPGVELAESAGRSEAEDVARRAAIAYMAGDPLALKPLASAESAQLNRCTKAGPSHRDLEVTAGPAEVRGGEHTAFARVEIAYRGKQMLGQDPFLVVLRRESSRWRAFAVTDDVEALKALPQLCRTPFGPSVGSEGPRAPRLTWPADGRVLPDSKKPLTWEIPSGGESPLVQVCELMCDEIGADARGESWPYVMLKLRFGEARDGSFPTGIFATGMPVRWRVWSIGASGRMAVSEARDYDFADYKKMRSSR